MKMQIILCWQKNVSRQAGSLMFENEEGSVQHQGAGRVKNGVLASRSDMRQDKMEISLWEVFF